MYQTVQGRIDPTTHCTTSSYYVPDSTGQDRSDDPSHHELLLRTRQYRTGSIRRPIAPRALTTYQTVQDRIDLTTHRTTSSYYVPDSTGQDRSDDPSHHELLLCTRHYKAGSIEQPIAPRAYYVPDSTRQDRSDDPSHHKLLLRTRQYRTGSIRRPIAPRALTMYQTLQGRIDPTTHRTTSLLRTRQYQTGSIRRPIAPRALTTYQTVQDRIDPTTHCTTSSYYVPDSTGQDRSDDPSHHELLLRTRQYKAGSIQQPIAPRAYYVPDSTRQDRSDDPSHHELLLRTRQYKTGSSGFSPR